MSEISFIRKHKTKNFTTVYNGFIYDKKLSWEAKGLLLYLLSRPDNWKIIIEDLINRSTNGKNSVYSIMKELKENRYIILEKKRTSDNKRIESFIYHVFEEPPDKNIDITISCLLPGNQEIDNQEIDNQEIDNRTLLNTDLLNTDIIKNSVNQRPNDLTDDFLKNKEEKKEFTEQENNLLDDLKDEPFYFSQEESEKLLNEYGFEKLEYFTRHVLCKNEDGNVNNPPGLLRHELKKNKFVTLEKTPATSAKIPVIENKNNKIFEFFRGLKIIAQAMLDYQKQEEITKFILRKHIFFLSSGNPETEQELINLCGNLAEIISINELRIFLENGLTGKLNEKNINDFIAFWNQLIK